jgi:RND family efflux transporter MFP subunit
MMPLSSRRPGGRVFLLGVACSTLLALSACGPAPSESANAAVERTPPPSRAVRVEVVELESGSASLELDLPGEVTGERDANLAAANGGFVERVLVREGELVTKGQTLMRVDTSLFGAQYEQAEAQRDQAQVDVERLEKLGDLGSDAQLATARTQLRVAEANRKLAATRLSRANVKAPFSGVVASVAVEEGEAVGPGGPVVRVVQLDPAIVTMSVSDRDVVSLTLGAPVMVTTAASSGRLEGRVVRISPAADARTRAFPVEIEVPNPDGALLPGMIARVSAKGTLVEDATVIPQDWVVTLRDERGVFLAQGDLAKWQPIELGAVIHDRVVVTEGLAPGAKVVITGHRNLVDGDPLIISREGTCCAAGRPQFSE